MMIIIKSNRFLLKKFNYIGSGYAEPNVLVIIKQVECSKQHFDHSACASTCAFGIFKCVSNSDALIEFICF